MKLKQIFKFIARAMYEIIRVIIPIAIIIVCTLGAQKIIEKKPVMEKKEFEEISTTVDTIKVETTSKNMYVEAYGTVQAYRRLAIQPQVGGKIVWQNPRLLVGNIIAKDEVLFRIEDKDYDIRCKQEQAKITKAEFDLKLEQGNQIIAKREWELLGNSIQQDALNTELALRKPHLEEKKAALMSAQVALDKANLDLARTVVRLPFDAIILEESLEIGQMANPQNTLVTVADINSFWVRVNVPINELANIDIPRNEGEKGSKARIVLKIGNSENIRYGAVVGILGDLGADGRMARILVSVEDALGLVSKKDPMLIGSYVKVEIKGKKLEKVSPIPRYSLRQNNQVWIKNSEGRLEIRSVDVVSGTSDYVFVSNLKDGEQIIVSSLSVPIPGMALEEAQKPQERDASR